MCSPEFEEQRDEKMFISLTKDWIFMFMFGFGNITFCSEKGNH